MKHYSEDLHIGIADWSSEELRWVWSSVTLTYFSRLQATILDISFRMSRYYLGLDIRHAD